MIPAKEFDGELWIKAADHHKEVNRMVDAERKAIYDIVIVAPFRQNVEAEENAEDLLFALKVLAFDVTSAIRARGQV